MTKFAIVFAAATLLAAAPTFTTPAAADPIKLAQADLSVRVGPGGVRVRTDADRRHHRHYRHRYGQDHYGMSRCKTTTIWRDGQRTTIRKCR
jgi:hypothetical protein